eukprot:1365591-Heterocapsa_arctica.AAC.1
MHEQENCELRGLAGRGDARGQLSACSPGESGQCPGIDLPSVCGNGRNVLLEAAVVGHDAGG